MLCHDLETSSLDLAAKSCVVVVGVGLAQSRTNMGHADHVQYLGLVDPTTKYLQVVKEL